MSFFNVPENLGFYDHTFVLQAKLQLGLISPAFVTQNTLFLNDAMKTLVTLLREKLETPLQVHGGYLAGLDTLLVAKNGQRMPGIQGWKDHSGNADRGAKLKGHHWSILGLISFEPTNKRYWCWVTRQEAHFWEIEPFPLCR